MRTNKNLHLIISVYLIISGFISLYFLSVAVIQNGITGVFWITTPLCFSVLIVTVFNNLKIVRPFAKVLVHFLRDFQAHLIYNNQEMSCSIYDLRKLHIKLKSTGGNCEMFIIFSCHSAVNIVSYCKFTFTFPEN